MINRIRNVAKQDPDGVVIAAIVILAAVVLTLGYTFKFSIA